MAEYIYQIKPEIEILRNIYNNSTNYIWNIDCQNIKKDDTVYFYVDMTGYNHGLNYVGRIAFVATVKMVLSNGIQLEINQIMKSASDELVFYDYGNNSSAPQRIKSKSLDSNGFSSNNGQIATIGTPLSDYIRTRAKNTANTYPEKMATEFQMMYEFFRCSYPQKASTRKLYGNYSANIISKYIQKVIDDNEKNYRVSEVNSYIQGCATEFDALIVEKNAQNLNGIYNSKDVVAVLEYKAYGIVDVKQLDHFIEAYKANSNLKIGYITLSESESPKAKVKFRTKTEEKFNSEKIGKESLFFVINKSNKNSLFDDNALEWEDFVLSLLP